MSSLNLALSYLTDLPVFRRHSAKLTSMNNSLAVLIALAESV